MEERITQAVERAVAASVAAASAAGNELGLATLPCKGKGKQLTAGKVEMVKQALEATQRVENAVNGAKRWFQQGVQIFEGELNVIADAKRQLQKVVSSLTGERLAEELAAPPPAPRLQPRPLPAPPRHLPRALPLSRPSHLRPPPDAPFHHHSPCRLPPLSASAVTVVVNQRNLRGWRGRQPRVRERLQGRRQRQPRGLGK